MARASRPEAAGVPGMPGRGPGMGAGPGARFASRVRPRDVRRTVRRIWAYFAGEQARLGLIAGLIVVEAALGMAVPWLLGRAVDALSTIAGAAAPAGLRAALATPGPAARAGDRRGGPARRLPGRRAAVHAPRLDHGRRVPADGAQRPRGAVRQAAAAAALVLRPADARRPHEPARQRRGRGERHGIPVRHAAHVERRGGLRNARDDARPEPPADRRVAPARAPRVPAHLDDLAKDPRRSSRQQQDGPRRTERPRRGDRLGHPGGEGLRPGARARGAVRRDQRAPAARGHRRADLDRLSHADDERHQQPRLRRGGRGGRGARGAGRRHRRHSSRPSSAIRGSSCGRSTRSPTPGTR